MKNTLRSTLRTLALAVTAGAVAYSAAAAEPKKLLVVTITTGFRHSSIEVAEKVLAKIGQESGVFTVDYVQQPPNQPQAPRRPSEPRKPQEPKPGEDEAKYKAALERYEQEMNRFREAVAKFEADEPRLRAEFKTANDAWQAEVRKRLAKLSPDSLKNYHGVIFANTTGDLPLPDREGFLEWIKAGNAFIGMHSATDTFHGFPPYTDMIGGAFRSHGAQVTVDCLNEDPKHPACRHLGPVWTLHDEIYIFRNYSQDKVHNLLSLDKEPNNKTPGHYPVAWSRNYGKGKVFYTSLGHREDVWENPVYQQHILGGIRWTLGLESHPIHHANTTGDEEGYVPLFNGKDLAGWKLRNPNARQSWSARDGLLVNSVTKDEKGTDLVSEEKFRDFSVRYEYMIPPGSNSGFYLRGRHEIQILDDFNHGKPSPGGNGAFYNHTPVSKFVSRKPGEWQTVEATMVGNRVTVWLNGEKVHDHLLVDRPTGGELDGRVNEPGPFMIQGDHGGITLRNLRVKRFN
jgi:uncharacterized protein